MSNNSSAVIRNQQEAASAAAAIAQQKSYIIGRDGGSVDGSSPTELAETGAASISYNGKPQVSGVFESSGAVPRFQPNLHGISMEWTPEEQAILEEGLTKYASESNIGRYAKIAVQLKNKTVRDVALRCKWIDKREFNKRRKPDLNLAGKGRLKEKVSDPSLMSTHATIHQGFGSYSQGGINSNRDSGLAYSAVGGITGKLLQQNAQVFECVSANLATHQIQENIGLLCRARDNILQILNNLTDPPNVLKQMPPLPVKIDEELANACLPPATIQLQRCHLRSICSSLGHASALYMTCSITSKLSLGKYRLSFSRYPSNPLCSVLRCAILYIEKNG